jgi:hypothetical protein
LVRPSCPRPYRDPRVFRPRRPPPAPQEQAIRHGLFKVTELPVVPASTSGERLSVRRAGYSRVIYSYFPTPVVHGDRGPLAGRTSPPSTTTVVHMMIYACLVGAHATSYRPCIATHAHPISTSGHCSPPPTPTREPRAAGAGRRARSSTVRNLAVPSSRVRCRLLSLVIGAMGTLVLCSCTAHPCLHVTVNLPIRATRLCTSTTAHKWWILLCLGPFIIIENHRTLRWLCVNAK